jgi:hypothetical protein
MSEDFATMNQNCVEQYINLETDVRECGHPIILGKECSRENCAKITFS